MSNASECHVCGAPKAAGLVACGFCKAAYPDATGGIDCPKCENVNRVENASCAVCHTALTRGCVFCGNSSSLSATSCQSCSEAFAGAEERKRQRDAAAQQQQTMRLVEEGIGVLGAVASASSGGGGGGLLGALENLLEDAAKK
jgi:hypothetical protein